MRIQSVRFKNLNSLAGEWEVDFTHPAFASDGIFAITGPTGAGKTTVLDAICLALYGRTPRLTRVNKSGNEVMSSQTGECFAEVVFETQAGRYRCHWSQHRARKKPDGELQPPKHEIAQADSGEIFESKVRGVAAQIEAATGMDFERFTRSMLLAQGDFDAFLRAEPDLRAPILEQITGTGIYSDISISVHERQRRERETLNLLQAEAAGIAVLGPEQEKEIEQALETKQKEEAGLLSEHSATARAIAWLTTIKDLNKYIATLEEEASRLRGEVEAFEPDRERLRWGIQAAALDGSYATLAAVRTQQKDDQAALKTALEAVPGLESSLQAQVKALKAAQAHTSRAKEDRKAAAPILQQVRALDQELALLKGRVSEEEARCKTAEEDIRKNGKAKELEQGRLREAEKALQHADGFLREHAQDQWLSGGLAGVEEQMNGLQAIQKDVLGREADLNKAVAIAGKAEETLALCQGQTESKRKALARASKRLQEATEGLGRLLGDRSLREYRAEKDNLLREMAFLKRIAALTDHRALLEDGKPCPLCGATAHPFAEGNAPVPDDTQQRIDALTTLIGKAEEQEDLVTRLKNTRDQTRDELGDAEKKQAEAASDQKTFAGNVGELKGHLQRLREELSAHRVRLFEKLTPLGLADSGDVDLSSLLPTLRTRLAAWQKGVEERASIEKQIAAIEGKIKSLDSVAETRNDALAELRTGLEDLKKKFADTTAARKDLYGNKTPDEEELRLETAVTEAEDAERRIRELQVQLQKDLNSATTQVDALNESIAKRQPKLAGLETDFRAALETAGFPTEERFQTARLLPQERKGLEAKSADLERRQAGLKARQEDHRARLAKEAALKITDKSLEELEPQLEECSSFLSGLREAIAGLKHQLSENAKAAEKIAGKLRDIEAQKGECRRWDDLHDLIGSADGKKYRNFAQGLTFEIMVGHANRQLQRMTDRYFLARDAAQPLELNVVDNYQAGEVRSTKNLSGGESFIVSLALALGLSHMASQNVRVDSLFLDEGFGTLDEEALETALEALAELQQDGKLIGVISHVQALKERINTQIQLTPLTGGKSELSGPGCRRLSTPAA